MEEGRRSERLGRRCGGGRGDVACAQRRRRTQEEGQETSDSRVGCFGFVVLSQLEGSGSWAGQKKFKLGQIIRPIGPYIGP